VNRLTKLSLIAAALFGLTLLLGASTPRDIRQTLKDTQKDNEVVFSTNLTTLDGAGECLKFTDAGSSLACSGIISISYLQPLRARVDTLKVAMNTTGTVNHQCIFRLHINGSAVGNTLIVTDTDGDSEGVLFTQELVPPITIAAGDVVRVYYDSGGSSCDAGTPSRVRVWGIGRWL
jgi:hypothetical protein